MSKIFSWTLAIVAMFALVFGYAYAAAPSVSAHPHDAPQIGDVHGFAYTPASCNVSFTSVTGRNISGRTAVFALERRQPDGSWALASQDNDGVVAYIAGVRYLGRAAVIVPNSKSFEIDHYQPRGDVGEYRWMSMWTGGPTDRGPLAGWTSHRPTEAECLHAVA